MNFESNTHNISLVVTYNIGGFVASLKIISRNIRKNYWGTILGGEGIIFGV